MLSFRQYTVQNETGVVNHNIHFSIKPSYRGLKQRTDIAETVIESVIDELKTNQVNCKFINNCAWAIFRGLGQQFEQKHDDSVYKLNSIRRDYESRFDFDDLRAIHTKCNQLGKIDFKDEFRSNVSTFNIDFQFNGNLQLRVSIDLGLVDLWGEIQTVNNPLLSEENEEGLVC